MYYLFVCLFKNLRSFPGKAEGEMSDQNFQNSPLTFIKCTHFYKNQQAGEQNPAGKVIETNNMQG